MVFWRKKKNAKAAEQEEKDNRLLHRRDDPEIEPSTDYEADLDEEQVREMDPTETELLENLDEGTTPTPIPLETPNAKPAKERGANEGGWFSRLTEGLSKSSARLGQGISDLVTKKKLDKDALADLEDLLIQADLGPEAAAQIIKDLSAKFFDKDVDAGAIKQALADEITQILQPVEKELKVMPPENGKPFVILMCGVNGAGKTTTIGKLAYRYAFREKRKVMLAAADTFRAAAVEQLQEWANRAHCQIITGDVGADAAAVAYAAYEKALEQKSEILIIDTAGRLQNKSNLMDELSKIIRVLKKHDDAAPHSCVLVLDGTSGQNAHSQVENFGQVANVSGLVVTKIDGAAKGGVVVALAKKFGLPVHLIGVGERPQDLQRFHANEYANALVGTRRA